jgi:hypothetical protein
MLLFFRLPFVLLEMILRQGVRGLGTVVRLLRGGDAGETFGTASEPSWRGRGPHAAEEALRTEDRIGYGGDEGFAADVEEPAAPPPPSAEEAIRRRHEREALEEVAPPAIEPDPPRPLRSVEGHVDSEATLVESFGPAGDPAAGVTVDEPWEGYDELPATAILARLRDADEATKAVVRLYEQTHKKRQTILRAIG